MALELGSRVEGREGQRLPAETVAACREALKVYTREQAPQQWAMTQNNLGMALSLQSERASGDEGLGLLAEAVAAYREALKVYTREQAPQPWAVTQNNLGAALARHGERASGETSVRLLSEAVAACREALEVRTRELSPQQWAMTHNNLGKAYYLLKDWRSSADSYSNVLSVYPKYEDGYQRLSSLFHEHLFEYAKAFDLHARWLVHFPDEIFALADFAETHFTMGRFIEFSDRIKPVLTHPRLPSKTKIALRMVEVANLMALEETDLIPTAMDLLLRAIAVQRRDFRMTWSFSGTMRYIERYEKLAFYRVWLTRFFAAARETNRDAILEKLREAQMQLPVPRR
ncbi:MAG TPA: hypothetical protein VJ302_30955 [Blastocatellia bacterium]|nr:hypothetical protein [Blastocatellia bacterium]